MKTDINQPIRSVTDQLSISEYLALSDDERYEEVRRATIATMSDELFNHYYHPTKKRWLDLARVWNKVHSCKKDFVLTSVIHKIYWGVTPYDSDDPDFDYLLSLVEAELLDNREGFQMFNKWSVFKRVADETIDSTSSYGNSHIDIHFIEHYHYLQARALCKLIYDKEPPYDYDLFVQEYQEYEKVVNFLIPDSINWNRVQWGDDLNVAEAMKQTYGVDYSASDEMQRNYERLILMLRAKNAFGVNNADLLWYASNISELPLSLAQKIWPANLEHTVANILQRVHALTVNYENCGQPFRDRANDFHPLYYFTRSALKQSWLFKLAKQWFHGGVYSGEQFEHIKTIIFDLEMAC